MEYNFIHSDCQLAMSNMEDCSIDCIATDPPYGINFQAHDWDKSMPDIDVWSDTLRVLKPGAYATIFSSIRLMHRVMCQLEDVGFIIKDVLFWSYLNGMPKSRNIALDIDKQLEVESEVVGYYKYVQGYKKGGSKTYTSNIKKQKLEPSSEKANLYKGAGLALKPAYEPIILVQKPIEKGLSVAQNIIKYGTGALNIEQGRLPYSRDDKKVGHNPHPFGRVPANILRMEPFEDGYDKFFMVPKVRQNKEDYNHHPTLKPVYLMEHLIRLTSFEGMTVLDPFMGSGSTAIASVINDRKVIGIEKDFEYIQIARRRIEEMLSDSTISSKKVSEQMSFFA